MPIPKAGGGGPWIESEEIRTSPGKSELPSALSSETRAMCNPSVEVWVSSSSSHHVDLLGILLVLVGRSEQGDLGCGCCLDHAQSGEGTR